MLALLAALQSLAAVVPSTPWASVQPTQDSPEDQFIRVAPLGSIGGCAAYAPRASYSWLDDQGQGALVCDASTPGRTCGGHSEPASFPSGMQLPRHNVPQFLGNAVWDGLARDGFGRLISAMMGDPFAFVVAPEVDALRRLLMDASLTPRGLAAQMRSAWSLDARYESALPATRLW